MERETQGRVKKKNLETALMLLTEAPIGADLRGWHNPGRKPEVTLSKTLS